ncbi:MAG: NAD-dependent epimerase/dehydratase family protein [Acidimicrobiia bacterium]|nr:NAD-dependent epimerase/dehydratase family protein [Acidimicrobiia bacterium]MBV8983277.1 NAD-dependent epimerase/dehydratase family protein [Acidimicrobiia bacterium]MBV9043063.1 NAD-dependent epimerase/dehydratase family protein [Acidimicrobiia bacterium]
MKVLVTGGAGFVGSHVVDALLDGGADVRVLDRSAAEWLDENAELVQGDIRDAAVVRDAVEGVDAVCHQAAKVGLGVDFRDATDYVSHNDTGTAVLLDALWRRRFTGRFVLASSMVVYGDGRSRCPAHGHVVPPPRRAEDLGAGHFEARCPVSGCGASVAWEPVAEDAATDPRNVYAATKLHQEHLCQAWGRETSATVVALRYHNVYGPRMPRDTPYAGVASIFRSALAAGRAPQVFEDGGQTRDFVHVRDVARANVLALTSDGVEPGAYNVASGTPRTVGDIASALAAAGGPGGPKPEVTGQWRLGDVRHIVACPRKAAEGLGFVAAVPFDEGMAEFGSERSAALAVR